MSKAGDPRVLYVIDSLSRSGAEQSLVSMAPHLLACGVDLEVAYLVERPGLLDEIRAAGVQTHAITQPTSRAARIRALRDLIQQRRPNLVHTTLFESDVAGRVAARLAGVPSVSSLVNVAYGRDQRRDVAINPAKLAAARWADRLTAKLAVRFHAITQHVAERMSHELGISPALIEVIPRGRDRKSLGEPSPARRRAVREGLGLTSSDVVLLAASRHEYQKGLDILVDAMPTVLAAKPTATLLIAGREGNQTDDLLRRVKDLGVGSRVRILGMRADVPDLMVAANVFVLPSRWEGFGGTVVEAMALSTPVVATDLPPVKEVAGDAALFCPPTATALGETIVRMLSDQHGTTSRVAAGIHRYETKYRTAQVATVMQAFYMRAIERASPKPTLPAVSRMALDDEC